MWVMRTSRDGSYTGFSEWNTVAQRNAHKMHSNRLKTGRRINNRRRAIIVSKMKLHAVLYAMVVWHKQETLSTEHSTTVHYVRERQTLFVRLYEPTIGSNKTDLRAIMLLDVAMTVCYAINKGNRRCDRRTGE